MAFLAGIALAAHVHLSISTCIGLGVISVLPVLLPAQFRPSSFRPRIPYGIRRPTFQLVCFALLFFFLGIARYDQVVARPATAQVEVFNDRKYDLFITGTVVDPPDVRDTYTNLRLRVESVDTGKKQYGVGGLLLARVAVNRTYSYGQNLRLRGRLQSPPQNEDFSYRDYLARQGVHGYMPDAEATVLPGSTANPILAWVYTLKGKLLDNVYRLFLDPEASLLAGILLGVDAGLPGPLQQAFKDTGTAHIIAISGFNIAIIAGIFVMIFSRFLGPWRGALAAVAGIAFYTFLVGADPSVVRAALMGTLSLFALQVGRRADGREHADVRGGHHGGVQSAGAVGRGLSTVILCHVRAAAVRESLPIGDGGIPESLPAGLQCGEAHRGAGRVRAADLRRATHHSSDHGLSFPADLTGLLHCQPVRAARATGRNDPGGCGGLCEHVHLPARQAAGADRVAAHRVYDPHGGAVRLAAARGDLSRRVLAGLRPVVLWRAAHGDVWRNAVESTVGTRCGIASASSRSALC